MLFKCPFILSDFLSCCFCTPTFMLLSSFLSVPFASLLLVVFPAICHGFVDACSCSFVASIAYKAVNWTAAHKDIILHDIYGGIHLSSVTPQALDWALPSNGVKFCLKIWNTTCFLFVSSSPQSNSTLATCKTLDGRITPHSQNLRSTTLHTQMAQMHSHSWMNTDLQDEQRHVYSQFS